MRKKGRKTAHSKLIFFNNNKHSTAQRSSEATTTLFHQFISINLLFLSIFHLQLDVQLQDEAGGDISSFITNGEWDLLGNHTETSLVAFCMIASWARCIYDSLVVYKTLYILFWLM